VLAPLLIGGVFIYTKSMSFGKMKRDPADAAFSNYIRTRDNWTCQRCGKVYPPPTTALHCSHFMGRGKEATRFDPDNCDALCYGCHQFFTSHPAEHYDWQVKKKGQKLVDNLKLRAHTYKKKDRAFEKLIWTKALEDLTKQRSSTTM
jgi:hypothetical protein